MQRSLRSAKADLGDEDYVYVSLANDPNLSTNDLVDYADRQGFDWIFAASTPEIIRDLASRYGREILVTPTMVHFVLRPDGSISEMYSGAPSPQQLAQEIRSGSQQG